AERPREKPGNLGAVARLVLVRQARRESRVVEGGVGARKRLRHQLFGVVIIEDRRAIAALRAHDEARAVLRPIDDPRRLVRKCFVELRLVLRELLVEPDGALALDGGADDTIRVRVDPHLRDVERWVRVHQLPELAVRGELVKTVPPAIGRPYTDDELAFGV